MRKAALRRKQLVSGQTHDRKVERHAVDERGGEDRVGRVRDHASGDRLGLPFGFDEQAVEQQGPVAEDDGDEWDGDVPCLGPDGHSVDER